MAMKQVVSKTEAVREYLDAHPEARISEIATALDKQGIPITLSQVATIKAVMYETEARSAVEKPTGKLTPEEVKIVAHAIKRIRSRPH